MTINIAYKPQRAFLPESLVISDWEGIQHYYEDLLNRQLNNKQDLDQWLKDSSELGAIISEDAAWRYIAMTCDTTNQEKAEKYKFFVTEIMPKIAPYENKLDHKLLDNPHFQALKGKEYDIMRQRIQKDVEIFREKNVPLMSALQAEQQEFGSISGSMSVTIDSEDMTLQKAGVLLEHQDREKREEAYRKIQERRLVDSGSLNNLFSKLIQKRHEIAQNADFENHRDYAFKSMGRFDYTPADCFKFHDSIESALVPLLHQLAQNRKETLKLDKLRPWDAKVDTSGKPALKAFENVEDLLENSVEAFRKLNPFLGDCLAYMREIKHLDLDSRKGKAPGGYNYPLMETGIPFIFMNATSTVRDLVTLMHEGGHAVHSILIKDLDLLHFKHLTPEIAELASMTMELLSMDHWDLFFTNPDDLKRAKANHLEDILGVLPWIAIIDKFQHWIYENPNHTEEEREKEWLSIFNRFSDNVTDWSGLEKFKAVLWQKQIHLFEFPFYYIEYAIAQLGAIAVWRNYRKNPEKALQQYTEALQLGYTRSIGEIYEAAGVKFDFSEDYMNGLIEFVKTELAMLE